MLTSSSALLIICRSLSFIETSLHRTDIASAPLFDADRFARRNVAAHRWNVLVAVEVKISVRLGAVFVAGCELLTAPRTLDNTLAGEQGSRAYGPGTPRLV